MWKKLSLIALFTVSALAQAAGREGPGTSGGGNGYQGRPLESYVVDITQFKEFKAIVAPAIEKLRTKLPSLADDLTKVANLKNWYFVPVHLPEIPQERLGVTFKTDQYALQSINAVWFDDVFYKGMANDEYRAMILVHELVMGLKLNSMYSAFDCTQNYYRSQCELSSSDYEAIRRLSVIILQRQDSISSEKIAEFLRINNFGRYNSADQFKNLTPLTLEDLHLLLISEQMAHNLPKVGRDKIGAGCAFSFQLTSDKKLVVAIQRSSGGATLHDYLPISITLDTAPELMRQDGSYSLKYVTQVDSSQLGSYRRRLDIHLNQEHIIQISAYWEQYLYDYRTRTYKWNQEPNGPRGSFEPSERICGR